MPTLYEQDFSLWLEETAQHLRDRSFDELDLPNLIEEIEGINRSDRQALKSNLFVILMHLLKYKYQPRRTTSWLSSLAEHRRRVDFIVEDSPSLESFLVSPEVFDGCYRKARKEATIETGVSIGIFPEVCPFRVEEALDSDWLPEG